MVGEKKHVFRVVCRFFHIRSMLGYALFVLFSCQKIQSDIRKISALLKMAENGAHAPLPKIIIRPFGPFADMNGFNAAIRRLGGILDYFRLRVFSTQKLQLKQ
jgi:hypothetical protein